jgi:hypothetical protein
LIGVNTFLPKDHGGEIGVEIELIRSTEEEKGAQIANMKLYGKARNSLVAGGNDSRERPTAEGCREKSDVKSARLMSDMTAISNILRQALIDENERRDGSRTRSRAGCATRRL